MLKNMTLLFFVVSCSLFKGHDSLSSKSPVELLDSVKLTGEGRGRLTLKKNQYVFSMESVLKENFDWILAVSIPLHGEEVMILPDLSKSQISDPETETFEERIEKEFHALKLNKILTSAEFMRELRSMIRFMLSPAWGQKRDCKLHQNEWACTIDGQEYRISSTDKELNVKKLLGQEKSLQIVAKNLTDSFFTQTDIRLYANEALATKKESDFSLELFW